MDNIHWSLWNCSLTISTGYGQRTFSFLEISVHNVPYSPKLQLWYSAHISDLWFVITFQILFLRLDCPNCVGRLQRVGVPSGPAADDWSASRSDPSEEWWLGIGPDSDRPAISGTVAAHRQGQPQLQPPAQSSGKGFDLKTRTLLMCTSHGHFLSDQMFQVH